MSRATSRNRRTGSVARWLCLGMILAIVIGGAGFVYKLTQFTREALSAEDISFAVVPVVVYICIAAGFLFLFIWALLRGQFSDVEAPKHRLLEEEERYDRIGV